MVKITDKTKCTGCGACADACPVGAISYQEDEDGFRYPVVNNEKCIECGKCESACPMLTKKREDFSSSCSFHARYFAGQLLDASDLLEVSSGGAFWAFTCSIMDKGGILYGAVQANMDQVIHVRVDNMHDARKVRRSKYLQSVVDGCYRLAEKDLKEGRSVLFSGTGCQIAALYQYLGRSYDNLFTCEVVCHGVPSLKAWRSYRQEHENIVGKIMTDIVFRDKSAGWGKNQYKITYSDGSEMKEKSSRHIFHAGYLQGLFYRPSCGKCLFASLPRIADLTVADYWKYQGEQFADLRNLGISLVSVNSKQGMKLFEDSKKYFSVEEVTEEMALNSCRHLNNPPAESPQRADFLKVLNKKGYYAAAGKYLDKDASFIYRFARKMFRKR